MRRLILLCACVLIAGTAHAATKRNGGAATAFDGRWSVEVITEQGVCDRAYRLSLGVAGGRITDIGDNIAQASGHIDPHGMVSVTLTRGAHSLVARGNLSGGEGSGMWRAPSLPCAGRWRAEKRS